MKRLESVLQRARDCGLKFNEKKCEFLKEEISYLGHIFTKNGTKVDPKKVSAVKNMPNPTNRKELQRFLGMVTYLSKYIQDMSHLTAPLREILEKETEWMWLDKHDKAVEKLKNALTNSPTLKFFDVKKEVSIECDASKDGLGAVLLQEGQPVAYCSRSMTAAEQRYAQIEKETLAIVFSLERFHQYVYGRKTHIYTDHKPIVAIFKKPFAKCPPRIQRFLLRLQPYSIEINYKKETEQVVVDTLSRATENITQQTEIPEEEVKAFVDSVVNAMDATPKKLQEIREKQDQDAALSKLRAQISNWPESIHKVPKEIRNFFTVREDITECDGLLLKGHQIIIPEVMKQEMLKVVHEGHLGIEMSQNRAKTAIFWPGMLKDIEETVSKCRTCQKYRNAQTKEPLEQHEVPEEPWTKVATDLLHFRGKEYLLVCDYFTKFYEICEMEKSAASEVVIRKLKNIFARYGVPLTLISDNGPQYSSRTFKNFVRKWQIEHVTTSPEFAQPNGFIERNVQTVKKLMKKAIESGEDPYIALMNFRATPKADKKSPAELLMGRIIRTLLPTLHQKKQEPQLTLLDNKVKERYDRSAKKLTPLDAGDYIRYRHRGSWEPAKVLDRAETPRSYNILTGKGTIVRRNRQHLLQTGETFHDLTPPKEIPEEPTPSATMTKKASNREAEVTSESTKTRSGRLVKRPARFMNDMN